MKNILIGIDDTDTQDSPGTGKLARRLALELESAGGRLLGTTGHQFFISPEIPYTGHNRGICIGLDWPGALEELAWVFERVREWSAAGSDPGVCLATAESIGRMIVEWGEAALDHVLTMEQARLLARSGGLDLRMLGGTGQGIIGALASVGLRRGGEHGRFVDLPGLRELGEHVTCAALAGMGIVLRPVEDEARDVAGGDRCRTLGWVRPRLSEGQPILSVAWSDDDDAWIPVERKKSYPLSPPPLEQEAHG